LENKSDLSAWISKITHDINTPLSVISGSNAMNKDAFINEQNDYKKFIEELNDEEKSLFTSFSALVSSKGEIEMSSREERQAKKKLAAELKEIGLENLSDNAGDLVKLRVHEDFDKIASALKLEKAAKMIEILLSRRNMSQNMRNMDIAVDKLRAIVVEMKNYATTV